MGYMGKYFGGSTMSDHYFIRSISSNKKSNYIDKKSFSDKVLQYSTQCKLCVEEGLPIPRIPHELGELILLLCTQLSNKTNFNSYTYKDDMVMDAVENCVKVLRKGQFNANAPTVSGELNAFGYFSLIAFRAMIRRIKKENGETSGRLKLIANSNVHDLFDQIEGHSDNKEISNFVNELKENMYLSRVGDEVNKEFEKELDSECVVLKTP